MEERSDQEEALDLIAAAREVLVDLLDEGIDALPRVKLAPIPLASEAGSPSVDTPEAPRPTPAAAPERSSLDQPDTPAAPRHPAPPVAANWGSEPTLEAVREALGDCQRCGLCRQRRTIVFGSGNPEADIMFIGEGPGEQEDRQGLPFVGRAGELLTKMIEGGLEIPRSDVYICNIVKCRPPGNRNPLPDEVSACRPFLDGQIEAVKPKVIVSLGKPAASLLLGREVAITRIRGTWQEYRGIPLMPTLHPAFVLRQYTPENRRNVWDDLKAALARSQD